MTRITKENALERESLGKTEQYLSPWRITWTDQRDDFGRDGFGQVVATRDDFFELTPSTFVIQSKAHGSKFKTVHSEVFETRHLKLWADPIAPPTILSIWSKPDDKFRFRMAKSAVDELDRFNPTWREQQTATIHFEEHTQYENSCEARENLNRKIIDEVDREGGRTQVNSSIRRLLISHAYVGAKVSTSQTMSLNDGSRIWTGPSWIDGEVDVADVSLLRLLISGLLLYEQVWLSMDIIPHALHALGDRLFFNLLNIQKIVPFVYENNIGFFAEKDSPTGKVVNFNHHATGWLRTWCKRIVKNLKPRAKRRDSLLRQIRIIPSHLLSRTYNSTLSDLKNTSIRKMLGLRPEWHESEPIWDVPLINRLIEVNTIQAAANYARADSIHYETGLSRIASEKMFNYYGLNRLFPTANALDSALCAQGVLDLGSLVFQIGLDEIVNISRSKVAKEYRDWFWAEAAQFSTDSEQMEADIESQIRRLLLSDRAPVSTRNYISFGGLYQFEGSININGVGTPITPIRQVSGQSGTSRLEDQRDLFMSRRQEIIKNEGFYPSDVRTMCPCGSTNPFEDCCGFST